VLQVHVDPPCVAVGLVRLVGSTLACGELRAIAFTERRLRINRKTTGTTIIGENGCAISTLKILSDVGLALESRSTRGDRRWILHGKELPLGSILERAATILPAFREPLPPLTACTDAISRQIRVTGPG
jgi:hypothetical protein